MPQIVPVSPGDGHQSLSTTLNGTEVLLELRWNARDGAWFMHTFAEDEETPLSHGVKIVLGASLWHRVADDRMPSGVLVAVDTTGEHSEPTLDSLGSTVELRFYTPEETETLRGQTV